MYWIRSFDALQLILYLILTLLWMGGGWLLATHTFSLHPRERLTAGLAGGFILFITLTNLLAARIALPLASWGGALLVVLGGCLAAWRSPRRPWLDRTDLRSWRHLVVVGLLTVLFTLIGRGLSLFDDYLHLPLVSVLAAGDFPPHFYLNPSQYFAYHYALQVWAATLVRLAGFFPWSAWDLAKGFAIALTFQLGWLWVLRQTGSRLAGWLGAAVVILAGGARWLLLLLPDALLRSLSGHLTLINTGVNTGSNLYAALFRSWVIEGGGKFPFPFAFHNGVFVPIISILGSTGALPFLTILLLLLWVERPKLSAGEAFVLTLVFANLALSAEHLYAFLWSALWLVLLIAAMLCRRKGETFAKQIWIPWVGVLLGSALIAVLQGGFITEAARNLAGGLLGGAVGQSNNFYGFDLRWPPAIYSAHLGLLSLLDPAQVFALVLELGPVLFLAPLAARAAWRSFQRGNWLFAGLGIAALVNFIFPLFLQYGVDRSITRLPGTALWLWMVLALPDVWTLYRRRATSLGRWLLRLGYGCVLLGGAVIFGVQVANIPFPQFSYFIVGSDTRFSADFWGKLDRGSMVLDRIPYRAVTLFGNPTRAHASIYEPLEDWQELAGDPNPAAAARMGYDYFYVDKVMYHHMSSDQKKMFLQPCVRLLAENGETQGDLRLLYDIRECRNYP